MERPYIQLAPWQTIVCRNDRSLQGRLGLGMGHSGFKAFVIEVVWGPEEHVAILRWKGAFTELLAFCFCQECFSHGAPRTVVFELFEQLHALGVRHIVTNYGLPDYMRQDLERYRPDSALHGSAEFYSLQDVERGHYPQFNRVLRLMREGERL